MRKYLLAGCLVVFIFSLVFISHTSKDQKIYDQEEEYEVEPKEYTIETEEEIVPRLAYSTEAYERWKRDVLEKGADPSRYNVRHNKSNQRRAYGVKGFTDNKLTGKWQQKSIIKGGGHRTKSTIYDVVRDRFYVTSHTNHIYEIDEENEMWYATDLKNSYGKASLTTGINLLNGDFRFMFFQDNGSVMYSDDQTMSWKSATGILNEKQLQRFLGYTTYSDGTRRVFAQAGSFESNTKYSKIYFSDDYGTSFTESQHKWKLNDFDVQMVKPYRQTTCFVYALEKSTGKLHIYKMDQADEDFTLFKAVDQVFPVSNKAKFIGLEGTMLEGNIHFYFTLNPNGKDNLLFYSNDQGSTFTQQSDITLRKVDPYNPKFLNTKNFIMLKRSSDYGVTTKNMSHTFPNGAYYWDIENFHVHEADDGRVYSTISTHFGVYAYTHYDSAETWRSLNRGSSNSMIYDADYNEFLDVQYSGSQDKGSHGFVDSINDLGYHEIYNVRPTDALAVVSGNEGTAVWSHMYYGQLVRQVAQPNGGANNGKSKKITDNWVRNLQLVRNPDPSVDGIVSPNENRLRFFTFNSSTERIDLVTHSHTFQAKTKSFGYSELDRNLWYVGLASNKGIMYSKDGGKKWHQSKFAGRVPNTTTIKASKLYPSRVYVSGNGDDPIFLISNNAGASFTNKMNGLDAKIKEFDLSPDESVIFAATNKGPYAYVVLQDKWFSLNTDDTPETIWNDVNYIAKKKIARFSTYGDGIWDFFLQSLPDLGDISNLAHLQTVNSDVTSNSGIGTLSNITDGKVTDLMDDMYISEEGFVGNDRSNIYLSLDGDSSSVGGYKLFYQDTMSSLAYEVSYWDSSTENWKVMHTVSKTDQRVNTIYDGILLDAYALEYGVYTDSIRFEFISSEDGRVRINEIEILAFDSSYVPGAITVIDDNSKDTVQMPVDTVQVPEDSSKQSVISSAFNHSTAISLYPNPVSGDYMTIQGANEGKLYKIYSIDGELKKEAILLNSTISVENLDQGMYLIRLESKQSMRFIKN